MQGANDTQAPDKEKSGSKKRIYLTRAAGVAILLAVIFSMNYFAAMSFDYFKLADYYNYDMDQLEKKDADIDMVILGASQVFYGCNTDLIAEELGEGGEVIDCASAAAYSDGMYYMLKDLLGRFTPKCVLIDLPWSKFVDQTSESTTRYLSADKMRFPGKLDYMFHCMTPVEGFTILCPVYRYGRWVKSFSQLITNFIGRKNIQEGNWLDESERTYRRNGFVWEEEGCEEGGIPALFFNYSEENINEEYVDYIRKAVELCKEKNIPVGLMTAPASCANVFGIVNYQDCVDYVQALADELECPYLNFNLLKGREELLTDNLYWDTRHLNGEGSIAFAPVFTEVVQKTFNGEDTSDLFYKNLEELKKDVHRIVGCNAGVTPNEDGTISVTAVSFQNEDITPQYRLLLVPKDIEDKKKKAGKDAADENGKTAASDEDDSSADDNQTSSDSKSEVDGSTDAEKKFQELRPWQDETTFLINEGEIPEGYALRIEARQKGKEAYDAFWNLVGDE